MPSPLARSMSAAATEPCRFVIAAADSARLRFEGVESHVIPGGQADAGLGVTIVLPRSYAKRRRQRYPLLVLADGEGLLGSAIEMVRGLAATQEVRECILVCHDNPLLAPACATEQAARIARIVEWCRAQYRVEAGEVAFFAQGRAMACVAALRARHPPAIDLWIVADQHGSWTNAPGVVAMRPPCEITAQGAVLPALVRGVFTLWGSGKPYGGNVAPLSHPLVSGALQALRPLVRRLRPQPSCALPADSRYLLRSQILDREFEIFVSLPPRLVPGVAYPCVVALDANTSWSCISEVATRMAQAGEIHELITVGIGTPRAEGDVAFGLRRFEEFSPPAGDQAFQGDLGRFFLSIFASFGLDARQHFGRAPQFHQFLREELLPELLRTLPIDDTQMTLVGHSAAGTYAAYEFAQPDSPFSGVAALSPGVAISDDWMLKPEGGLAARGKGRELFVSIGGAERDNAFNILAGIPRAEQYAESLRRPLSKWQVDYHCLEGETHTTVFARAYALLLARRFAATAEGEKD